MSETLDTIIIGAGSAGLAALREVRKHTDNYRIVNDGPWGTTCARVGCMPSKLLIEAANAFHERTSFDTFGIRGAAQLSVDLPAVLERVRELRDVFVSGTIKDSDAGDHQINGRAELLGPTRVRVNGKEWNARSIIVATGTRPRFDDAWRSLGNRVLTTDTLFEQTTLGRRIAVLGLGPIGLEMAQALARLGIEVTAFATKKSAAGLSDPDVLNTLWSLLEQEFAIHVGDSATLNAHGDGVEVVSGDKRIVVDQVLVATGRVPNVEGLGLATLGVPLDDRGLPKMDPNTRQVGALPVFIAGDLDPSRALLHEAVDEGHIAGMNAMADTPQDFRRRTLLAIGFCQPNAAIVGKSFKALVDQDIVIGHIDFSKQGRARVAQQNAGLLRLYAERSSGKLLGAEMCAPAGEHLAHLLALAINNGLTVQKMLNMPIYHPVLEEGLRTALRRAAAQLEAKAISDLDKCDLRTRSVMD
ncbi:dihydrolipoyl dehydrogenase [Diaphorobacter aerolatus]|uniref:Dihydrolipoyl dehydrogenase n=1 Tax=Diaphorobacter aerolatus TaxID=1288495 RepID=A0A7H0GKF1_9BURK|nr:dihydrolipoyl dehydrogenase [Diaphorobacter aerolatus]QNP48767.1 dihydrolipoyl dehydrogenase [Diaphorobacter aerolatus]